MSGSGLLPRMPAKFAEHQESMVEAQLAERADVLGLLARKQAGAEAIAERMSGELRDKAVWAARNFAMLAEEIRNGLHVGEVAIATALASDRPEPSEWR